MAYTVKLADKAQRQIEELPQHIRKRVARWIDLIGKDLIASPPANSKDFPNFVAFTPAKIM